MKGVEDISRYLLSKRLYKNNYSLISHSLLRVCIQTSVLGNEKVTCLALCELSKISDVWLSVPPGLLYLLSQIVKVGGKKQ